jgi:putative transposase
MGRDGLVLAAFIAGKGRSGSARLVLDLGDEGHVCGRETAANSMIRQGLCAKVGRKFKVTTNSKHELPGAKEHAPAKFCGISAESEID